MMHRPRSGENSREGRKQVMVFASPALARAVYAKARAERKTRQEIIGEAINAAFRAAWEEEPLQPGHLRLLKRTEKRATRRKAGPACRTGRLAIGGWYPAEAVQALRRLASIQWVTAQKLVLSGLEEVAEPFLVRPKTESAGTEPATMEIADVAAREN